MACEHPAVDSEHSPGNARAFTYRLCKLLYVRGCHGACAQLCNAVLADQASGNYMTAAYSALRDGCRAAETQPAPRLEAIDTGIDPNFDPFGGIEIEVLQAADHH